MLTFFFILIFAAEVKIAYDIISLIRKFDRRVCEINVRISEVQTQIPAVFSSARIAINTALLNINGIKIKIAEKKDDYKYVILKNVITAALFLALNVRGKQAMTAVELAFSAKDFTRNIIKLIRSFKK